MSNTEASVDVKKATLSSLVFIHQKLVATAFYPEEFASADRALKLIVEMAQGLDTQIQSAEQSQETEPVTPVVVKRTRKPKQA